MYSIVSRERRITNYVVKCAYDWLYRRIMKGDYVPRGRDAEKAILKIKKEGKVDNNGYKTICGLFVIDPYQYMMHYSKKEKLNAITADSLSCYFIRFNNTVLPAGFIEEFFEDDYETKADIAAFYNQYLDGTLKDFSIHCQDMENKKYEELEKLKESYASIFNTRFGFHFTNILKVLLAAVALALSVGFLVEHRVITQLFILFSDGESAFVEKYTFEILANIVLFIYSIKKLVQSVKIITFYIYWFYVRIYVGLLQKSLHVFDAKTVETFVNCLRGIAGEMRTTNYRITDELCAMLPASRKKYIMVANFKGENVEKLLVNLYDNRLFAFFAFRGTEHEQRAACKKGIVFAIFVIIAAVFMNVPECNVWISDFIEGVKDEGFFEYILG